MKKNEILSDIIQNALDIFRAWGYSRGHIEINVDVNKNIVILKIGKKSKKIIQGEEVISIEQRMFTN